MRLSHKVMRKPMSIIKQEDKLTKAVSVIAETVLELSKDHENKQLVYKGREKKRKRVISQIADGFIYYFHLMVGFI